MKLEKVPMSKRIKTIKPTLKKKQAKIQNQEGC
jgi:hypothetical protein